MGTIIFFMKTTTILAPSQARTYLLPISFRLRDLCNRWMPTNSRGICPFDFAAKVLIRILLDRIHNEVFESITPEDQCEFRSGKSPVFLLLPHIKSKKSADNTTNHLPHSDPDSCFLRLWYHCMYGVPYRWRTAQYVSHWSQDEFVWNQHQMLFVPGRLCSRFAQWQSC